MYDKIAGMQTDRLTAPPVQYLDGVDRTLKIRPSFGSAIMGTVNDGRIGASVKQQIQASHAVVLRGEVHGNGIDAVVLTAKIVPQIGISTVIEQPCRRFNLIAVTCP